MGAEWWIYIVSTSRGHLYTGISTDVERRFREHCDGGLKGAKALKGKGPLKLRFSQSVGSRSEAQRLEARIKKLDRKSKLGLIKTGQLPDELFR